MEKFLPYFFLGLALAAIGVLMLARGAKKKSRRIASVVGTITAVNEKLDIRTDNAGESRRYRYIPTYSYEVNGDKYTFEGVYAYDNKNRFKVGDTATFFIDPNNPSDAATQDSQKGAGKTGIVLILIGIALCVLACTQL